MAKKYTDGLMANYEEYYSDKLSEYASDYLINEHKSVNVYNDSNNENNTSIAYLSYMEKIRVMFDYYLDNPNDKYANVILDDCFKFLLKEAVEFNELSIDNFIKVMPGEFIYQMIVERGKVKTQLFGETIDEDKSDEMYRVSNSKSILESCLIGYMRNKGILFNMESFICYYDLIHELEVELKELSKSVNLENSEIRTFCDYGDTRPYIDNVINVIVDNYSNKKSK